MVNVHHTGDPVEPESIELILLNPKPQVAEQEPHDFMVSVVEEATVPEFVSSFPSFVEVKVIGAVELVQPIEDVLAGMRMNDIQEDRYAHAMCGVDEFLQVLGQSIA